jgi:ATP phosphoribosyltransferase regulatory subunit
MEDAPHPALLPAGLRDLLPPHAESEAASVDRIMSVFAAHAYRRVEPPLLEYEESFLRGSGAAVAEQSFRIMDPDSHRMMVLRADMTPQIARIAATRLAAAPRPLRLCYAGQCVRVTGNGPSTGATLDRQVPQAGIELIGADSAEADAEIMLVAVEALGALGLSRLSLDLTLPTLVPMLLDGAGLAPAVRRTLSHALDRKDAAAVAANGGPLVPMLTDLLHAAGPAAPALEALRAANLPEAGRALAERLEAVIALVHRAAPGLRLTVDPVEFRGYRYHTGLALTVFAPGRHEELGRGGRYFSADEEPATGVTLYADAVLRAAPVRADRPTLYVPAGTPGDVAGAQRAAGFATLAGLAPVEDAFAEAARLGCTHVLVGGAAQTIGRPGALPLDPAKDKSLEPFT